MKIQDSGMPEEAYWKSLFDIEAIISWLNIKEKSKIVEIGCGYGTFTWPMAKSNQSSHLSVFDIEQQMLEHTQSKCKNSQLNNVEYFLRDVTVDGTGLEAESVDMVLLFNLLHSNKNRNLLKEAERILKPGGLVSIIHWRKDIETPRGPDVKFRPSLNQITSECSDLNLEIYDKEVLLKPYHWGIKLIKTHR